ncbi:MAG: hypothetical protein GX410_00650 [Elusimicrobia bacterium]|nr:hypothetical protein [Elusimicrobiota bacterium]
MLELFGYAASVITALSLMMSNIWKLRWLNMTGSAMLMVYAVTLRAWPVAAVNAFIVVVDMYYIWQLSSKRDLFSLMEVPPQDKTFLKTFLELYREDMHKYFPSFDFAALKDPHCVFILRNLMPVGLFVYENEGNATASIRLDYVIPSYRDLSSARFFYNTGYSSFIKAGFREFVLRNPSPVHAKYAARMGFSPSAVDPAAWVKPLASGKDAPNPAC